jgi:hypothetical protein
MVGSADFTDEGLPDILFQNRRLQRYAPEGPLGMDRYWKPAVAAWMTSERHGCGLNGDDRKYRHGARTTGPRCGRDVREASLYAVDCVAVSSNAAAPRIGSSLTGLSLTICYMHGVSVIDISRLFATSRLVVFRTSDMALEVGADQSSTSRALTRLQRAHLLTRLVRGVWADTRHPLFSPYIVAPLVTETNVENSECYVSFVSALNVHGMISQFPRAIHLATTAQRRPLKTPIGESHFHQIDRALFDGFEAGDKYGRFALATPTKALFDTLYISTRRSKQFSHLPELELPRSVTDREMQRWILRIPSSTLRVAVNARWQSIRASKQRAARTDVGAEKQLGGRQMA